MNYALIGLIWGAIKHVVNEPIVQTALDHWTAGTSNKIDDWVWEVLKMAAGVKNEEERKDVVKSEIALLQDRYDKSKEEGSAYALKQSIKSWDSAMLNLNGNFNSGNFT
jgi:5-carboxymethyl-2-hydroxymuconate isomerase